MILHVVSKLGFDVDYMVGAQLEGYDCMVKLTESAPYMILEGDEYLSSPIDRRPKFHLYKPHAALISGIAWDHINVFPTFENYTNQFKIFCNCIEPNGTLVYNSEDKEVNKLGEDFSRKIKTISYKTPNYKVTENGTEIEYDNNWYSLKIFGAHNLQNLIGAMKLSQEIGISPDQFLKAMSDFTGAGKRLQKVVETDTFVMYKDFAHSPSKLMATTKAVKEQYPNRELVACMELHTFSSLKKEFLPQYKNTMNKADHALVYFNPEVVDHKKLDPISIELVKTAFGNNVIVVNETNKVLEFIKNFNFENKVLLMMSSGTFDGIDYEILGDQLK
jgi:UDP-N-acetylmuramate: L-alanyl-gamma-D-glutamyl-meso-diaminopimelate ligase